MSPQADQPPAAADALTAQRPEPAPSRPSVSGSQEAVTAADLWLAELAGSRFTIEEVRAISMVL